MLKYKHDLASKWSLNAMYLKNSAFQPDMDPSFYIKWSNTNFPTIGDLLDQQTHTIISLARIQERAPITKLLMFEFFQICHFVTPYYKAMAMATPTKFEILARKGLPKKRLISII
ncbi:hypothetical protein XELAEV_18030709mg [Xenopus laevis]|uniref:Uncharacterized protein n=1 Tax=Xenopus laevis TaxID=8355 RepID=A0A974HF20_XENLA|nr:hypothetical protein XELAEV_18030709mg [Xenopus laevis]